MVHAFFRRKPVRVVLVAALLVIGLDQGVRALVHYRLTRFDIVFSESADEDPIPGVDQAAIAADPVYAALEAPAPFVEVQAFDEDAMSWSNQFCHYTDGGFVLFDANGDGRLDVYVLQDGQNWTRPTDEKGILTDRPRRQHNGLYLNQGNDEAGRPKLVQVKELARTNGTNVAEEILVEGYLSPRTSLADPEDREGRMGAVAVAADVNADGRPDLLVGNALPGMPWSHPDTQYVMPQFVMPWGREARRSRLPLSPLGLHLLAGYRPRNDVSLDRASSRGTEPVGANTLYLNRGDADGDGIPEWEDASRSAGFEGRRNTTSFSVADFDLDGDLDVYCGNVMDPDFWPAGSKSYAGAPNELYVNQLVETGRLTFVERAAELGVDEVYGANYPQPSLLRLRRIRWLPKEYSLLFPEFEEYRPPLLSLDGESAEGGQITWSTVVQDVDDDGWPDLWVANDLGYLRLYRNVEGKRFERLEHAVSDKTGLWMAFAPGDLDGDLVEDLYVGNSGGSLFNQAITVPDPMEMFDPVTFVAVTGQAFFTGRHRPMHVLFDGRGRDRMLSHKVLHSKYLPPDTSLHNNLRVGPTGKLPIPFDADGIDPYEFAWGSTAFDVQNDGTLDLYFAGCVLGRGGGLSPIEGTGPGRLLVNAGTSGGRVMFADRTAEHRVFNILGLEFDHLAEGWFQRRAPSQNWGKRDLVRSTDRSTWSLQGLGIQEHVTNHDMIQTAENGRGALAADLNGDGFEDLLVRNLGGYDSRSPKATNLKVRIDGVVRALPPHDHNFPSPTQFEPGSTRLFLNAYTRGNWIEIRLVDDAEGSANRDAIGARVVVNGRFLRWHRASQGSFVSNKLAPIHVGLGAETARRIEVRWPDRARTVTTLDVDSLSRGTLTIDKARGSIGWVPR